MIPGETYENNDRIKVYVLEVRKDSKGPQVLVSRTHPGLVKRLFELEVLEIQTGVVQIKSIAREAGFRTKVAVHSTDMQVDVVMHASASVARVPSASLTSCTTKIDIIEWDSDFAGVYCKGAQPCKGAADGLHQ